MQRGRNVHTLICPSEPVSDALLGAPREVQPEEGGGRTRVPLLSSWKYWTHFQEAPHLNRVFLQGHTVMRRDLNMLSDEAQA